MYSYWSEMVNHQRFNNWNTGYVKNNPDFQDYGIWGRQNKFEYS